MNIGKFQNSVLWKGPLAAIQIDSNLSRIWIGKIQNSSLNDGHQRSPSPNWNFEFSDVHCNRELT